MLIFVGLATVRVVKNIMRSLCGFLDPSTPFSHFVKSTLIAFGSSVEEIGFSLQI